MGEALPKSDGPSGSGSGGYYMVGAYKAMKGSQLWRTPGVSQIMLDAKDPHSLLKDKMHPQWEAI